MIYVTHDQVEAMTLADKIVVLRKGKVEQVGKPLELYHNPDNRFVAGFIGSPAMNFVSGTVGEGGVEASGLAGRVQSAVRMPASGKVTVGLRPQHLRVLEGATHRVDMTEALGGVSFIHVSAPSGEKLVIEAKGDVIPASGSMVGIGFDASDALFFDEVSGLRLR
jgi:lactose/L-arabinose transport system ATP-binding protein